MSVFIKSLKAFPEFDSRGNTTLAGKLVLSNGGEVTSSIANHLPGKDKPVYMETGKAIKYVNQLLSPKLVNINPLDCKKIDHWLDKIDQSNDKQVLGINTSLLVSKLIYKAGALSANQPLYLYLNEVFRKNFMDIEIKKLPIPIFTLISGASHGSINLNFQEFSIVFSSSLSYSEAVKRGAQLHKELEKVFEYRNIFSGVGADGAYVPNLSSNFDALEIIKEAMMKNGYRIGLDIFFALDIASDFFYKAGKYYISEEIGNADSAHLLELYEKIFKEYRFLILEDPFIESDSGGWKQAMARFGDKAFIMGDHLLMANQSKLEKASKDGLCSMADLKITHLPTIWQVMEFMAAVKKQSLKSVVSQTAIETNDDFISDLSVATQSDYVKFGPPVRGERVAKHNRLLAIETERTVHE